LPGGVIGLVIAAKKKNCKAQFLHHAEGELEDGDRWKSEVVLRSDCLGEGDDSKAS